MTITVPKDNFLDKILHLFGKRRAFKMPESVYNKYGPYVYAHAIKESFWRALLRHKGQDPPAGYFYDGNTPKPPSIHNS
jgi:hypothetical protein